jgi:hypothetical protein
MTEQTHWGPDPGHGGLTQHKGLRADCSGPDCGSDEGSHFHQATQRLEASDWQWQEHGFKGALREAIVAQVHSNLAVAFELRRLNEDRSQWYREVLGVLTQAKDSGICDSERPVEDVGLAKCALQRGHDKEHRGSIEGRRFMWP